MSKWALTWTAGVSLARQSWARFAKQAMSEDAAVLPQTSLGNTFQILIGRCENQVRIRHIRPQAAPCWRSPSGVPVVNVSTQSGPVLALQELTARYVELQRHSSRFGKGKRQPDLQFVHEDAWELTQSGNMEQRGFCTAARRCRGI
jgi:hypothetical protein